MDLSENLKKMEDLWDTLIAKPDWYLSILPQIHDLQNRYEDPEKANLLKSKIYDYFESKLRTDKIALGSGKDMDSERKPIDTIIIHHTSNPPGMSLERLSAIELIRLYAPYFANPTYDFEKHLRGTPIYSGHARSGKQVFWPYHWFVQTDGSVERLLQDHEIGWHAGNWEVNCRSVAICFDNDYENDAPSGKELATAAEIIKTNYPKLASERIFGHREINPKTTCPSNLFLSENGRVGWKEKLISLL